MDWSKIKNVFIITFLILDLFLAFQMIQQNSSNQLEQMAVTSFEDRLAIEKITHVELPKEPTKAPYITAKRKVFKEEDVKSLKNQNVVLETSTTISSRFKDPIAIPKGNRGYFYEEFLRMNIVEGQKYKYWERDDKEKKLYFFQQYRGQNIFYNDEAMIVVNINEKDEIISYTQTLLTDVTEMGERHKDQDIITATKALETLFWKEKIKSGSNVRKAEIGYYTIVFPSSGAQVIVPTWHFVINKEDFYVNAIEGQIFNVGKDNKQWSEAG